MFKTLFIHHDPLSADKSQATLHLEMRTVNNTVGVALSGGVLLPGRWGHVACTFERSRASLIVDGALAATGVFSGASIGRDVYFANMLLFFVCLKVNIVRVFLGQWKLRVIP